MLSPASSYTRRSRTHTADLYRLAGTFAAGGGGFDDQLNEPELYRHDESREAAHLLPYTTVHESLFSQELVLRGPFSFVQTNWFLLLSGLVVSINIILQYTELVDNKLYKRGHLWLMSQLCLAFYSLEVMSRLLHFRGWFFVHRSDRMWNMFDLVLVTSGVADEWLVPILFGGTEFLPDFLMPVLRAVRLLKLMRLVKLLGVLIRSNLAWTDSAAFSTVVSAVILLSILLMGLETDMESPIWAPLDNMVLLFFTFELAVKIRIAGWDFFDWPSAIWNCLDAVIVVCGVVDQWILPLLVQEHIEDLQNVLLSIRMFRLLRVLRLLRLVKAVRPLFMLAQGMVQAMQSMFWVLVLTLVALYTSAILMTRVIGHGVALDDPEEIPAVTKRLFETVPTSMFTLFLLMNGEEWIKVEPLLSRYPSMKVAFILFTIFSSWALLSVMTGVVSDNMIFAREEQNKMDDVAQGERRKRVEQVVREIFIAANGDETNRLKRDRYNELLDIPYHAKKVQGVVPQLPQKEIRDLFGWLNTGGMDEVDYPELLRGFLTCAEPITGKALLQVDSDIKHRFRDMHRQVEQLNSKMAGLKATTRAQHEAFLDALEDFMDFGPDGARQPPG